MFNKYDIFYVFNFFILLELFWLASNSSPFAAAAEALATASEPAESFWLSKLSIKLWQGVARKVSCICVPSSVEFCWTDEKHFHWCRLMRVLASAPFVWTNLVSFMSMFLSYLLEPFEMQSWRVKRESSHVDTFNQGTRHDDTMWSWLSSSYQKITWHLGPRACVWIYVKQTLGAERTCHTAWGPKQQRLHRCQSRYCALACHEWQHLSKFTWQLW